MVRTSTNAHCILLYTRSARIGAAIRAAQPFSSTNFDFYPIAAFPELEPVNNFSCETWKFVSKVLLPAGVFPLSTCQTYISKLFEATGFRARVCSRKYCYC